MDNHCHENWANSSGTIYGTSMARHSSGTIYGTSYGKIFGDLMGNLWEILRKSYRKSIDTPTVVEPMWTPHGAYKGPIQPYKGPTLVPKVGSRGPRITKQLNQTLFK